ncbi:MAG: flagellar basal body-associated FliL family protein [Gammaproteobacteria bacterium]|nr:flagellar basal body-associated FliL family protein [Gammaproteobacteria bacterium]MCP5407045.1 flagellar basal body-associated FliL family protein [Chromatiaceae bacterium]MCP5445109.1 flagellar basal body-associated FliL family protein [Chromatiaceae bacterium]
MRISNVSLLAGVFLFMSALPTLCSAKTEDSAEKKPFQYYELKPSIVANIQKGAKYLRADIQLMTQEEDGVKEIERHAAALRHELFLLISDQEGSTLKDSKGKEEFRKSALKALQKVMLDISGKELVEELFFSSFFVQ